MPAPASAIDDGGPEGRQSGKSGSTRYGLKIVNGKWEEFGRLGF